MYSSTTLNLGTRWLHAPDALTPERVHRVPIGYEAGWVPEPTLTLRRRETFLSPAGNRSPVIQPLV
jgi:hypothetical protein